ncbi:MAG: hypothetical protein WDZ51_03230 [Pirellulaceae bacterium]
MSLIKRLWNDEAGFIVSAELVLVGTIAVLGMIVGLSAARDGVTSELADVSGALNNLNQSYTINNVIGHGAAVAGSQFLDDTDYCDGLEVPADDMACIVRTAPTAGEPNAVVPVGLP